MYYGYGYGFNRVSSGVALDPDAQAFITAASITDPTQQSAVNQLVLDLKSASIWTDIDALFPFVGGSAISHRYDLKSATALGTFAGGVTHNANGVTFNGTTGYFNTGWAVSAGNLYDRHFSQYVRTLTSGSAWSGVFDGATSVFGMYLSGATILAQVGCNNLPAAFSQAISAGLNCVTVDSNTVGKVYNNGNLVHTTASAINDSPQSGNMFLGALNVTGTAQFYHNSNLGIATFGKRLDATKQANLYTAVQTFQTTLSRNV